MHTAFTVFLLSVLTAAVVYLVAANLAHSRRARAIARQAHEMGLRFSIDDPFGMPARYADFALVNCGHSPIVHNVAHGRLAGLPVRCCDFSYELGHGTRRVTCRYAVAVMEYDRPLPEVMMWDRQDPSPAPLGASATAESLGRWAYVGSGAMAGRLAQLCRDLAPQAVSIQVRRNVAVARMPVVRKWGGAGQLDRLVAVLADLARPAPKAES